MNRVSDMKCAYCSGIIHMLCPSTWKEGFIFHPECFEELQKEKEENHKNYMESKNEYEIITKPLEKVIEDFYCNQTVFHFVECCEKESCFLRKVNTVIKYFNRNNFSLLRSKFEYSDTEIKGYKGVMLEFTKT